MSGGKRSAAAWFYAAGGQPRGPISVDKLGEVLWTGATPAHTPVWREGMADWTTAETLPELADAALPAPAPTVEAPPDLPPPIAAPGGRHSRCMSQRRVLRRRLPTAPR